VTDADAALMRRAIALAGTRLGATDLNPAVGCVIARDGAVVAEAATAEGGRPHAEEQALAAAGEAARGAVVYVTLEPCGARSSGVESCAERLAAAGVTRVLVACEDPSPYAAGRGLTWLRTLGVTVEIGVLADEAAPLYEAYRRRLHGATANP
jgi:diaminohydroxyphosphoribosylaminopyrimidine deaminase/5-amino-6-(5-phosphoribosylamino)uracil reductase